MMTVRTIHPSDEAAYLEILRRMSSADRYFRFFRAVDHFEHVDVARFVDPGPDTLGLIAESDGRPVGAAHAFITGTSGELAVIVAPDARRAGVASALLGHLGAMLRARRVKTLSAFSLTDNYAFAKLARRSGMQPSHAAGDGSVVTWTLALDPPAAEEQSGNPPILAA